MKKFLFNIIKNGLIVLLVINLIAYLSLHLLSKSEFYKPSYLVNHFEKGEQFDYILLGSSRGLTTINTAQLDELNGTRGVNLSIDDTSLPSHFLMLKHFLNKGFATKKVILNIDTQSFNTSTKNINNNDYRFAPFLFDKDIHQYYSDYENEGVRKLTYSKYLPFLSVAYYNAELFFPSVYSLIDNTRRNRFDDMGNYTYPENTFQFRGERLVSKVMIDNPLIQEVKKLCDKNDITLILYIAPIRNYAIDASTAVDVQLINHSGSIDDNQLYYDLAHVNHRGREVATSLLAKALKK